MAPSDGGKMRRDRAYPASDRNAEARAVCAGCPLLEGCLLEALRVDGHTFRGGFSPEERASLGGARDVVQARRREPWMSARQVWSRAFFSRLPQPVLLSAFTEWAKECPVTPDGTPVTPDGTPWAVGVAAFRPGAAPPVLDPLASIDPDQAADPEPEPVAPPPVVPLAAGWEAVELFGLVLPARQA